MAIIEYGNGIFRDTNVIGENVYLAPPHHGQSCDTIWLKTVAEAENFLKHYGLINGHAAGVCNKCKCHYSYKTKEWKIAPFEYACKYWKRRMRANLTSRPRKKKVIASFPLKPTV